jgi:hypothetical protein
MARWALNTWILATIRVSKITNNPTSLRFAGLSSSRSPGCMSIQQQTSAIEGHE